MLDDAVRQLVRHHVVGRGVAGAEDHLVAAPERVVQRALAGRAEVRRRAQLAAVAEVAADQRGEVDAQGAGEPGCGGAGEVVGLVGVGDAGRRPALDPVVVAAGTGSCGCGRRRRRPGRVRRPRPAAARPARCGRRPARGRGRPGGQPSAPGPARPGEARAWRGGRAASGRAASGSAGSARRDRSASPCCAAVARRAVRAAVEAATSYVVEMAGPRGLAGCRQQPAAAVEHHHQLTAEDRQPAAGLLEPHDVTVGDAAHPRGAQVARGHAEHPADAVEVAAGSGDRRGPGCRAGAGPGRREQPDPAAVVPDQPDRLVLRGAVRRRGGLGRRRGTEQRAERADRQRRRPAAGRDGWCGAARESPGGRNDDRPARTVTGRVLTGSRA